MATFGTIAEVLEAEHEHHWQHTVGDIILLAILLKIKFHDTNPAKNVMISTGNSL